MGTVYRARDSRLRRDLAIKVLHHSIQEQPTRLQRFQEEARAAGSLTHPNILAVYDVGMDGDTPYIAMELVDGVSLRQLLDGTALSAARLLEIAIQIADGLAAAHHASLVHRDLKPANVMVTRDGRVKLVDFGLVKAPAHADDGNRTLTAPHAVIGTASYMSPEQARGSTVDFRSDIFSFGTILLEMITGRAPFERATAIETLTAILHEPPQLPPLSERMPLALNWIVQRCLAKDPAER